MGPFYERSRGHKPVQNRTLTSADAAKSLYSGDQVAKTQEAAIAGLSSVGDSVRLIGAILDDAAGRRPRQELTGRETGMQGPFVRDCNSEPIPEVVLGDEGPVHDKRVDQQWPADYVVIIFNGFGASVVYADSEAEADRIAVSSGGLAYRVHGDKALTLTGGSMM